MGLRRSLALWLRRHDEAAAAATAYRTADFAEAGRLCRRLLERQPTNADALQMLGLIALRAGDFPAAVRHLEQAVRAKPDRLDLHHDLGEALVSCGRVESAAPVLEHVAAARPATADECALVAGALLRLGREDQVRAQIAKALASDPDHPDALTVAAHLAAHSQDWVEAARSLRVALQRRTRDPALMSDLALALVKLGQLGEAEILLRKALSLAPAERGAQIALVELLERQIRGAPSPLDGALAGRDAKDPANEPVLPGGADHGATAAIEPFISVIICNVNPAKFAAVSANYAERLAGHAHEIIGIHDAKSLSEGYNRGARRSRGDIVIFSHDDIEILTPDFGRRLKAHLGRHDVIGPCGTSRLVAGHWMSSGWPRLHGLVAPAIRSRMNRPACTVSWSWTPQPNIRPA